MLTIRTLTREDADAAADLTARIFSKPGEYDGMFAILRAAYLNCPFMPPELCYAGFVDDRLVAKWQIIDFELRVGRSKIRLAGIQGVVAEPDENHKRYPLEVAAYTIRDLDRLGFDVALGFAQRGAFYRRIGAVPIMAEYELELDARQIPALRNDPFHEWSEAELPALIDFYNESNAERSGSMVRTLDHWPWMVRKAPEIHICDEGYLGVRHYPDCIEIRELGGHGEAFHHAALCKLADIARKAGQRKVRGAVPADHPLVLAAIPYGAKITADYTKKSGCLSLQFSALRMLRKLEQEFEDRLLASRHHDEHVDLGVRCDDGETRLSLNPKGRSKRKIDIRISPGPLQQLVFGYRSVRDVLFDEANRGEPGEHAPAMPDEASIAVLETVFPHGHPFMWQPDRY